MQRGLKDRFLVDAYRNKQSPIKSDFLLNRVVGNDDNELDNR